MNGTNQLPNLINQHFDKQNSLSREDTKYECTSFGISTMVVVLECWQPLL